MPTSPNAATRKEMPDIISTIGASSEEYAAIRLVERTPYMPRRLDTTTKPLTVKFTGYMNIDDELDETPKIDAASIAAKAAKRTTSASLVKSLVDITFESRLSSLTSRHE